MKVEVLEFKRCCCCFPLRYGLLVWGYLKLIISTLMVIFLTSHLVMGAMFAAKDVGLSKGYATTLIILAVLDFILLIDIALNITFLVGGHKKNPRLLRVYNYYSIGILILYILVTVISFSFELSNMMRYTVIGPLYFTYMLRSFLASAVLNVGVQVYFILMTRSEILKLENNCNFSFVNNANGECTMTQTGTETSTEETTGKENNEKVERSEKISGNYARL